MCGFRHFLCQVELGLVQFCVVLGWTEIPEFCCCAGPLWALWFLCGCFCCCCCWFMVDPGWSLSGRRALSAFPRPSGATPRPWQWRCPWGVLISFASVGALFADLFGSGHMETEDREGLETFTNDMQLLPWFDCRHLTYACHGKQKSVIFIALIFLPLKSKTNKNTSAFSCTLLSQFQQKKSDLHVALRLHIQSKVANISKPLSAMWKLKKEKREKRAWSHAQGNKLVWRKNPGLSSVGRQLGWYFVNHVTHVS